MTERKALKVLIVDDEPLAVERLQLRLGRCEGVTLAGTAADGVAAMEAAQALEPDLLLLDISMPGMDGLDVARTLAASSLDPAVIFVTALDNFAVAAFDVAAADYLMKPVHIDRLVEALERARGAIADRRTRTAAASPYVQEFWVPGQHGLVRLPTREVDRVTTERNEMRLHVGHRTYVVYRTTAAPEEVLDPEMFIQIDNTAMLRRDAVAGVDRDDGGDWIARLRSGKAVRIGDDHVADVKRLVARG